MTESVALTLPSLPTAACAGTSDPDAFFAFSDQPARVEGARSICRRCPEIRDCLAWALTYSEYGIWAGTTEEQRKNLRNHHTLTGATA